MGMQVSCQKNATEKNLTTALKYESLKMPFKQGKKVFIGFELLAWKNLRNTQSIISWNLNGFEGFKRMDNVSFKQTSIAMNNCVSKKLK